MKFEKYLNEGKKEKHWSKMSDKEKRKVYDIAIKSGNVKDTFKGFSKQMNNAIFDVSTGKVIEVA